MSKAHLLALLDEKISVFGRDSTRHKKLHLRFRYTTFTLSALSGIFAGLALIQKNNHEMFNILILLISGVTGLVASIEGLRKPSELWIHERKTFYALTDLRREIDFLLDEDSSAEMNKAFFGRMQSILGAAGEKWSNGIAPNVATGQPGP
jgi:Protein of unknown function (DUF4231)